MTAGGSLVNLMIKAFFSSFHFSVRAKSLAFFAFTKLLIKNSTMLETMIEYKSAGKPEMLAQIFNSLGKEGTSSIQVTNATRSPRVQQAQSAYDTQQVQQQYQQQYEQQQAMTQAQQQSVNPQAANPQATQGGR